MKTEEETHTQYTQHTLATQNQSCSCLIGTVQVQTALLSLCSPVLVPFLYVTSSLSYPFPPYFKNS